MRKIPETELEKIKKETDLLELIRLKGIKLKKHGKDYIGLCPFHNDTNPSLVVTPSKNLWNCLGACQTGGSVIDWIMKAEGVSFKHAVEILRDKEISTSKIVNPEVLKKTTVPKLDAPIDLKADQQQLLNEVVEYYHSKLLKNNIALAYLEKRGLKDLSVIKQFKIGFADRTLGLRLPAKNRKSGKDIRDKLKEVGIYRDSGHEHFNGAITFPIFDENNNVTEIYGRKLNENAQNGISVHLYLPNAHKGIFNYQNIKDEKEIILCESIIDALSFYVNGYTNVTTSYGVSGFTNEMLEFFVKNEVSKIYFAYDNDEAGNNGSMKAAKKLAEFNIECLRMSFPKKIDANDFIQKMSPPRESLRILLNSAVWIHGVHETAESKKIVEKEEHTTSSLYDNPSDLNVKNKGDDIFITFGDNSKYRREYRVKGLKRNQIVNILKINLCIKTQHSFYTDTIDLYNAKNRAHFFKCAQEETKIEKGIIKKDVGKILLKLEEIQYENLNKEKEKKVIVITEEERKEALEFLKDENIFQNIARDFEKCGMIGEKTNSIAGYIAVTSRKLDEPLAVLIQSSSAAGKTSLMDAVLAFVPDEDKEKYTAITGKSLFYMGLTNLVHKTLAISEEEGAEKAVYAIKTFQSEKQLCIATTEKDAETGRMSTRNYEVKGPVQIIFTTTSVSINEELQNRCIILTVNENREQTQAIHKIQRQKDTLNGIIMKNERDDIAKLHQNAQRLLRKIHVVNNYAPYLTFTDQKLRSRRDNQKYLTMIKAIALLRQYQKTLKSKTIGKKEIEYIEVDLTDIEIANNLACEIFGQFLDDLPPQTHKMLNIICKMVQLHCQKHDIDQSDYTFTRRNIREYSGWSNTQIKIHLDRLVDFEYIYIRNGSNGQRFEYELVYKNEGKDNKKFILCLTNISKLKDLCV